MNSHEIENKIKLYTICKFIIIIAMALITMFFVVEIFVLKHERIAIIAYIILIIIVIIAYMFPLNAQLSKYLSARDYRGILEYLAHISDEMCEQRYFDGLVMIKNSLDEIAHYQIDNEEQYLKDCIFYLQSKFHSSDKKQIIPSKLFNRDYVRKICTVLIEQVETGKFVPDNLETIKYEVRPNNKYKLQLSTVSIGNIILFGLVIYKIIMSVNTKLYDSINMSILKRLVYNVGADIIAIMLALLAYLQSKRK